ncbi:MAG: IPT/TIG domain-containing protein [Parafilimonas sp.]
MPSCKKEDKYPGQSLPDIITVNPTSAIPGAPVDIKGVHLKDVTAIKFGTVDAVFQTPSDTSISAIVPDSLPAGDLYVQVYVGDGVAYAAQKFTILEAPKIPTISSVTPDTAFPGNNIIITGINFMNVSSVTFGSTSAAFIIGDSTKLTVTVPLNLTGANQTITVSAPTGSDTASFTVNFAPVIASVTPNSGSPGDVITIKGVRFNNITSVKLGATSVMQNVVNDSTITFPVPASAQNGFITVTNALGTATSPQSFVVVQPISLFIFDDALITDWSIQSYSATTTISTDNVESGSNSLATTYTSGYGAFRIANYSSAPIDLSTYTTLRFSVYGGSGTDGKQISVAINGNYGTTQLITISEGKYTDYFIPLSSLGSPATLGEIVLQEFSGNAPSDIYVDNIGLN